MYNLFGEWHKGVNPDNNKHRTYLIWENIDLLSNNDRYTVVTFGVEKLDDIFSSVMVFDKEGKDILSENSEIKSKVIDFFSKEIRKKKNKKMKTIFYQKYIKQFKPEYWKKYKNFPNVKIHID